MADIRTADAGDLTAVRAFGHRVVGPYYDSLGLHDFGNTMLTLYWDSDSQLEALQEDQVFVARDGDGDADGIVGIAEYGDYSGEPVIWKLYVDESARGSGIGKALIDRVIEVVSPPADSLLIEHAAENTATGEIYEHLGFHVAWIDPSDTPGESTVWRRRQLAD